ncbi:hypothetical protein D9M69_686560 [compost metagenome]
MQAVFQELDPAGQDEVAETLDANHFFALIAQPLQLRVVDRDIDAVDVQRVVAAGCVVVQVLRPFQRLLKLQVGTLHLVFAGFALGDVDQGAVGAHKSALFVRHDGAGGQTDEGAAV